MAKPTLTHATHFGSSHGVNPPRYHGRHSASTRRMAPVGCYGTHCSNANECKITKTSMCLNELLERTRLFYLNIFRHMNSHEFNNNGDLVLDIVTSKSLPEK